MIRGQKKIKRGRREREKTGVFWFSKGNIIENSDGEKEGFSVNIGKALFGYISSWPHTAQRNWPPKTLCVLNIVYINTTRRGKMNRGIY